MTTVGVTNFKIGCIWRSYVRTNDSYCNDIVDNILQNNGRYIALEREEEIVESFTNVRKPEDRVTYIRDTQKLSFPERYISIAETLSKKRKWNTPRVSKI